MNQMQDIRLTTIRVKEQDLTNNLFWLDYGARQYDPTRGQFTTPDPLAEKYYSTNYFTYCMNNPMKFIDPDGRDWYKTSKGNLYWNPEVKGQKDLQEGYIYIGESYYETEYIHVPKFSKTNICYYIMQNSTLTNKLSHLLFLCTLFLCSCVNNKHDISNIPDSVIRSDLKGTTDNDYICGDERNYFIKIKDSLIMMPGFAIRSLYSSDLESYKQEYSSVSEFTHEFLTNKKFDGKRKEWSYHCKINWNIYHDYEKMSFEEFWNKYCNILGKDTLLIMNDTTLAFCFDVYGYNCFFLEGENGKPKIVKRTDF